MAAFAQLHAQSSPQRYQIQSDQQQPLGLQELQALSAPERALRPEELDLEGAARHSGFSAHFNAADDLRLPGPPIQAQDSRSLATATARVLAGFQSQVGKPVAADSAGLVAEARMVALLNGIQRLQVDIRSRAAEQQSA